MKSKLAAIVAAVLISVSASPAKAGYYETATNLRYANEFSAWAYHFSLFHLHWADYYNYVDYGLIYNAWQNVVYARDNAWYAYWSAPIGSSAEYWSLEAYDQLVDLEYNMWIVYAYGGVYPSYTAAAITNALYGQIYLSYAAQAAAGQY